LISPCALDDLVEKEDSYGLIGSGGLKLSGGERQRLVCKPNSMLSPCYREAIPHDI
jgi:ABC-type transport system involved in cytochrome bd biosynthesis fused ATPase/permease subunit